MSKKLKFALGGVGVSLVVGGLVFLVVLGLNVFQGITGLSTNQASALDRPNKMMALGLNAQDFTQTYSLQQVSIPSSQGDHEIPADVLTPPGATVGTVVMAHGLGGNRLDTYPTAQFFLDMGYRVLAYDQRSSGENTAPYNTFGYLESYDLLDCVAYASAQQGPDQQLLAWGVSFGGATVATALGRDDSLIDAAILDCPVDEAKWMVRQELDAMADTMGIPAGLMLFTGDLALRAKLGFSLDDADAKQWIASTTKPVLVFGSTADTVTPSNHVEELYQAIPGTQNRLLLVDESPHAHLYQTHEQLYRKTLAEFIATIE